MKLPQKPPSYEALAQDAAGDGLAELTRLLSLPIEPCAYIPWDKLRFKKPPHGLTAERWWLLTKWRRAGMRRALPLEATYGASFGYALPDEVLQGIDEVNRHAGGTITGPEPVANPATRDQYLMHSLIEEAITSSQLEGASTTHRVAKEMIREGRSPRTKSERMIFNNFRAMRRVGELRDQPLTPDLICEIHRIVSDGTLDDPATSGRFQLPGESRVVIEAYDGTVLHRPPHAEEIPARVQQLCAFANAESAEPYVPPVVRAIIVHFTLAYIHPFHDGNGRTSRALFYWSMLRHGFWLAEFLSISRILTSAPAKYARSFLHSEQDDNDLTYFVIYHLDVIRRAIKELHEYLDRKSSELAGLRARLADMPDAFNHRQVAIIERALKRPDTLYTVASHGKSHRVTPQTARTDLNQLAERGLLKRVKSGRGHAWTPVTDLAKRLEQ